MIINKISHTKLNIQIAGEPNITSIKNVRQYRYFGRLLKHLHLASAIKYEDSQGKSKTVYINTNSLIKRTIKTIQSPLPSKKELSKYIKKFKKDYGSKFKNLNENTIKNFFKHISFRIKNSNFIPPTHKTVQTQLLEDIHDPILQPDQPPEIPQIKLTTNTPNHQITNALQHNQTAIEIDSLAINEIEKAPAPVPETQTTNELTKEKLIIELNQWEQNPNIQGYKRHAARLILNAFEWKQKRLDLSRLQLTELPSCIGKLTELQVLLLHSNHLSSLPPEIGDLSALQILELNNNQFPSFPLEICKLSTLKMLYVGGNKLTSIPPEIGNFRSLKQLFLYHNKLTSLPPEIGNLHELQDLFLTDNRLSSLPPEIGNLRELRALYLTNNQLSSLPPEIGNLRLMQLLLIHNNQLTSLPPEIGNLTDLNFFFVTENRRLKELPLSLGNLMRLTDLSIEGTNIPRELARSIMREWAVRRSKVALNIISTLLDKWLITAEVSPSRKYQMLNSIKAFEVSEQQIIYEWLIRLEKTPDYRNNQKKMSRIACKILETATQDPQFKADFIAQASPNNVRCPDRAAMALNEIYVIWKIHTLPPNASLKDKLELLVSAAKTLTLRRVVMELIDKNAPHLRESVEVFLFCEIELKNTLQLLSPIDNMLYRHFGDHKWIKLDEIKQAVLNRFYKDLANIPAFMKMKEEIEKDENYQKQWQPIKRSLDLKMEQLENRLELPANKENGEINDEAINEDQYNTEMIALKAEYEKAETQTVINFIENTIFE